MKKEVVVPRKRSEKVAKPFDFGPEFQKEMLALMLTDITFTQKIVDYITPESLYSDAHAFLFRKIADAAKKNSFLTEIQFEDRLLDVERAKRRAYARFGNEIFAKKPKDASFIKAQMTDYAKKLSYVDLFSEAQVLYNTKKFNDAYKLTMENMSKLYAIDFTETASIPFEQFEDMRLHYLAKVSSKIAKIATGIPPLDDILSGGLEKGELGILLAEPKKGKSIGLLHMAITALQSRHARVAYFLLEGTTDQFVLRALSRATGIEYERLAKDDITKAESKRVDRIMRVFKDRLDMIPMNKRWNYTALDIEGKLRELKNNGKNPDLVCIDYADLLTDHAQQEKRHVQTEVYRNLKALAMMGDYAIWTASQAQRPQKSAEETYLLRAKDISESYEKVRIADLVATLNQTPEERLNGILRLHVDIYRSSDADETIRLLTDFTRMIFYSPKYGYATRADSEFSWMKKRRRGGS